MTRASTAPKRDIHAEITGKLIAAIEADPGRPVMPWRRSGKPLFMPENALTGNAYNGINIVSLWVSAECAGFSAPVWATYRQWSELGAQVRKGEKSSLVVFYKEYETDPNPDVTDDDGKRRVARASYVFNAAQVDGYALPDAPLPLGPIERLEAVDRFVTATGARIEHGGERAFYRPSTDHIQMPDEALFCGTDTMTRTEGYYATITHELTHWTAAPTRLGRELGKRFGDAAYAAEELVALSGQSGCGLHPRARRASYRTRPGTRLSATGLLRTANYGESAGEVGLVTYAAKILLEEPNQTAVRLGGMKFLAVIITGLSLIAPAAHAFELLNKIGLPKAEYFIVQQIYNGWWMAGLLLPLAFLANAGNAIALRDDRTAMMLSVAAAALIALNLVIFMLYTQPANAATQNWTVQPENWEALRAQWEYSHAVNAAVNFSAFCCATLASIR